MGIKIADLMGILTSTWLGDTLSWHKKSMVLTLTNCRDRHILDGWGHTPPPLFSTLQKFSLIYSRNQDLIYLSGSSSAG